MKIAFLLIAMIKLSYSYSQSWECYLGLSYTNVRHIIDGQQIIYAHTFNSPLWNIGAQVGINRVISISESMEIMFGGRLQLKGDKDSKRYSPENKAYGMRFVYFSIPLNLKMKILKTKDIFFKYGISGEYLVYQNKTALGIPYFNIYDFSDKLGLSGQLGFIFDVAPQTSIEIMYSQGLTNIYKIHNFGDPKRDTTYKHQLFEASIAYKL